MIKRFGIFVLVVFVVGLGVSASSATDVVARLSPQIRIFYNGEQQALYDADGRRVYPLSFQDTTYVPIRGISDLFGVKVDWDQSTQSVILGNPSGPVSLISNDIEWTKYSWHLEDKADLTVLYEDGLKTFSNGLAYHQWNGGYSVQKDWVAYAPVTGASLLSFSAYYSPSPGSNDYAARAYVFDGDFNILDSFEVGAGRLVEREVRILGKNWIGFAANGPEGATDGSGILRILDPLIS
jgi:hypothetical protein